MITCNVRTSAGLNQAGLIRYLQMCYCAIKFLFSYFQKCKESIIIKRRFHEFDRLCSAYSVCRHSRGHFKACVWHAFYVYIT